LSAVAKPASRQLQYAIRNRTTTTARIARWRVRNDYYGFPVEK